LLELQHRCCADAATRSSPGSKSPAKSSWANEDAAGDRALKGKAVEGAKRTWTSDEGEGRVLDAAWIICAARGTATAEEVAGKIGGTVDQVRAQLAVLVNRGDLAALPGGLFSRVLTRSILRREPGASFVTDLASAVPGRDDGGALMIGDWSDPEIDELKSALGPMAYRPARSRAPWQRADRAMPSSGRRIAWG
jgi:hypothetical protein